MFTYEDIKYYKIFQLHIEKINEFMILYLIKYTPEIQIREQAKMSGCLSQVKSSHLYLYSAFNNTNCNKALHNIKIGKLCQ